LADWVGGDSHLIASLVEALRRYVFDCGKLHADDTPVPMLAPGIGKTKTARLWTYVRDDRPAGDTAPPAVWFVYSPEFLCPRHFSTGCSRPCGDILRLKRTGR
jgi:transposase